MASRATTLLYYVSYSSINTEAIHGCIVDDKDDGDVGFLFWLLTASARLEYVLTVFVNVLLVFC